MYPALSTSNSYTLLKFVFPVLLTGLIIPEAIAQGEWSAGSRFEVGGDGSEEYSEVTPYIGYSYNTRSTSASTRLATSFGSYYDNYWSEGWESNNDLSWASGTRLVTINGSYDHEYDYDSDDDSTETTNDFSLSLGINVPQSARLVHQFSLQGIYQSDVTESDETVTFDEITGIAGYDLIFRQTSRVEWSSGVELEVTDSDTQTVTGSIGWAYETSRYDMAANSYIIFTEYDSNENENYGWDASVTFKSQVYTLALSAERSQTDNLSFVLSSDVDIELERQYLATVTEASIAFSDYDITDTLSLYASATIGRNESVYELSDIGLSNSEEYDYYQLSGDLIWQISGRSTLTASIDDSEVNSVNDRSVSLLYKKNISDHWNASAYIEREIKFDDDFSWYIAADYTF